MTEAAGKRWGVEQFPNRLEYLVRKCGGAASLARAADVSDRVIGKWKSGGSEPTLSRLVALARAGKVSVEWLATGAGSPDDHMIGDPTLFGVAGTLDPELVAEAAAELHELVAKESLSLSAQEVRICVKAAARIKAKEPDFPVRDVIRDLL